MAGLCGLRQYTTMVLSFSRKFLKNQLTAIIGQLFKDVLTSAGLKTL